MAGISPQTLVARWALLLTVASLVLSVDISLALARAPALVAIQPVRGAPDTLIGASLRVALARLVRARGYRVVVTMPSIESPGQYWAVARDHRVTAFVVADLTAPHREHRLNVVILDGAQGSVLGRWVFRAPTENPGRFLARDFWKHLGPALEKARAPEPPLIPPVLPCPVELD